MNTGASKAKKPAEAKAIAYRGPLNPTQAAAGINAAIRNAKRLLTDAERLFQVGSYPSAISLAVLAIEEAGKRGIIERILLAKSDQQRKTHWREYTSHTAKNNMWVIPNLVKAGAEHVGDFRILADDKSIHTFVLDDFKMWGFYTECRGAMWTEPANTITPQMAFEVLHYARSLIRNTREVTPEQMAVYVKHMAPVWTEDYRKADSGAVRNAMKSYMKECQQHGWLSRDIDIDDFFRVPGVPSEKAPTSAADEVIPR